MPELTDAELFLAVLIALANMYIFFVVSELYEYNKNIGNKVTCIHILVLGSITFITAVSVIVSIVLLIAKTGIF